MENMQDKQLDTNKPKKQKDSKMEYDL